MTERIEQCDICFALAYLDDLINGGTPEDPFYICLDCADDEDLA